MTLTSQPSSPPEGELGSSMLTTLWKSQLSRVVFGFVESERSPNQPISPCGVQMASKPPRAKSFVCGKKLCKRLIFLKWHGRGQGFESLQVHQTSPSLVSQQ